MRGSLSSAKKFQCKGCNGDVRPLNWRPVKSVAVDGESFDVVDISCYLGHTIVAGGAKC